MREEATTVARYDEPIAAGGDTDTLAAMVGGIVAARVGADRIPERWRAALEPID